MQALAKIEWDEDGVRHSADWRSESGQPPPRRVVVVNDQTNADQAYRLACEGTALLYRGDFHNARQLLQAMARRIDRKPHKTPSAQQSAADAFHLHRQAQAQRARTLGMLLLHFEPGHHLPLRRAPDVRSACEEAYGPAAGAYVASLRELQGLIGAHEWRKKGVDIPALGAAIHPWYGVYSPLRGEYLELVAQAPLPAALADTPTAFDIGTGTGVIAALLAQRRIPHVVATELDPRALACARDNLQRLGCADRVDLLSTDMFPPGRAALVVCNPPWVPARPSAPVEHAVYDPDSRMLKAFLAGLADHLVPGGEGWLILSDLAEHLGLRSREALLAMIAGAGLEVAGRLDMRPKHRKASDANDPLHAARSAELTSLWRLVAR